MKFEKIVYKEKHMRINLKVLTMIICYLLKVDIKISSLYAKGVYLQTKGEIDI